MKGIIILILTISLFVLASVSGSVVPSEIKKSDNHVLPKFSFMQKLLLKSLSSRKPKLFHGLSFDTILKSTPKPKAYPEHLYVDYYFVDYRQLLTQAIKIPKTNNLPEVDYTEHIDFCFWIYCFDYTLTMTSAESFMAGTQSITTKSGFTPTTFFNRFSVPHFRWSSPDWTWTVVDNSYGDTYITQGYHLSVDDFIISISSDYEWVENVGIQIKNLEIGLSVRNFTTTLDLQMDIDSIGNVHKEGPFVEDITQYMMEDWEWVKEDYTENLQHHVNCLLSNTRIDPEACQLNEDKAYNDYYRFLIMEVLQTMGLGSLLN